MTLLEAQKSCELHLHMVGAFHVEDALRLGSPIFRQIDWYERDYINHYQSVFGTLPDPIGAFETALAGQQERLRQLHYCLPEDGGSFDRFLVKIRFFQRIWSHYWHHQEEEAAKLVAMLVDKHVAEGLTYVEYRCSFWGDVSEQVRLLSRVLEQLKMAEARGLTARLIVNVLRKAPLAGLDVLQALWSQRPELACLVVGFDFANPEMGYPPKMLQPFMVRLQQYNQQYPERAVAVVNHVGENFSDKSLESAIRWCHEVAEMGVCRLGHALVLGLDPDVALGRWQEAHEWETAVERLDQIAYDLHYQDVLRLYGVAINEKVLQAEQAALQKSPPGELVRRPYTVKRRQAIRQRQQLVLERLVQLGTVIECCPTSNMRIAGIPSPREHPLFRFLQSDVHVAICSDDPGTFNTTLAQEVAWVQQYTPMGVAALAQRLGDPHRFRLR